MPADKDLAPTARQRSLVRHKKVWRVGTVTLAILTLAFSVWMSLDGDINGLGWAITAVWFMNVFTISHNIATAERQIAAYDARPHQPHKSVTTSRD